MGAHCTDSGKILTASDASHLDIDLAPKEAHSHVRRKEGRSLHTNGAQVQSVKSMYSSCRKASGTSSDIP